jgi:hypothetical protein
MLFLALDKDTLGTVHHLLLGPVERLWEALVEPGGVGGMKVAVESRASSCDSEVSQHRLLRRCIRSPLNFAKGAGARQFE